MKMSGLFLEKWTGTLLVAVTAAGLIFSGCTKEKKEAAPEAGKAAEQAAMPADHPPAGGMPEEIAKMSHGNIKTQKEIRLADEVKKKWKEVQLQITDNASGRTEVVTMEVGAAVKLNDAGLRLRVEALVPDYSISENRIESRSNDPNNPAVLVELLEGDKSVARGWIFKNFPEFNSYTDNKFNLVLLSPGAEKK